LPGQETHRMKLQRLTVGLLQVNCYVVWDEQTRDALVIDPGGNAEEILRLLNLHNLRLQRIVNTHSHFDHVGGVRMLQEETKAPFYIHPLGSEILALAQERSAQFLGIQVGPPPTPDDFVEDGQQFSIGEIPFTVRHTPGHSPGGICLLAPGSVFTGDTLFAGSIGRYDIPGSSFEDLMNSIRTVLLPLPDDTAVYPGHGPATSMASERAHNPFLRMLMGKQGLWDI